MGVRVRRAGTEDATVLSALLASYLHERYPGHRGTHADELRRDLLTEAHGQRVLLAESGEHAIGFVAWDAVYDLHWAARGAQIADPYVVPACRGRGVALLLLTGMCSEALREGATFLRGASYDRTSATGRFYERIAIGADSAECHCSGKAFRTLAGLHRKPVRTIVRSLPPKEWNLEP